MNDCEVLNKDCTMQLITCVREIIILHVHSHCNSLWAYLAISLLAVLVQENKLLG